MTDIYGKNSFIVLCVSGCIISSVVLLSGGAGISLDSCCQPVVVTLVLLLANFSGSIVIGGRSVV